MCVEACVETCFVCLPRCGRAVGGRERERERERQRGREGGEEEEAERRRAIKGRETLAGLGTAKSRTLSVVVRKPVSAITSGSALSTRSRIASRWPVKLEGGGGDWGSSRCHSRTYAESAKASRFSGCMAGMDTFRQGAGSLPLHGAWSFSCPRRYLSIATGKVWAAVSERFARMLNHRPRPQACRARIAVPPCRRAAVPPCRRPRPSAHRVQAHNMVACPMRMERALARTRRGSSGRQARKGARL